MNEPSTGDIELDARALEMINRLIQQNLDARAGYEAAANHVGSEQYRAMLGEFATQRAQFAEELGTLVRNQGEEPTESGTLSGLLQQGWINLKAALTNGDGAILAECQTADEVTLSAYQDAIGETTAEPLLVVLRSQFTDVRNACERVRALTAALHSRGR
jgi:uncharacterized protein (TIGR02284 family)